MADNVASQTISSMILRAIVSRTTLAHAVSGSIASCAAMSLTYPFPPHMNQPTASTKKEELNKRLTGNSNSLERARTTLIANPGENSATRVLLNIIKKEGYAGLFSGLSPMLVALGSSNFVFFYWHTALKAAVRAARPISDRHLDLDVGISLFLAFVAGCINVVMTSPLWVAFTRMMSKRDRYAGMSIFEVLSRITGEEGLLSLWSGLMPSLVLVSNPTIQFVAFEKLKSWILRSFHGVEQNQDKDSMLDELASTDGPVKVDENEAIEFIKQTSPELTSIEAFVVGGLSKLIATILTYPLQVAQTEMRAGNKYKGTVHCLMSIYEKEGIRGWFKGFNAKIVQTVLTSAAMFLVYEKLSSAIFIFLVRRKLRAKAV